MTSTVNPADTRAAVIDARAALAIYVASAEKSSPRARAGAWRDVEKAEYVLRFAQQDHEMAVRASMPGAAEADIQTAARAS